MAGFIYEVSTLGGSELAGAVGEFELKLTLQLIFLNLPISPLPMVLGEGEFRVLPGAAQVEGQLAHQLPGGGVAA